MAWGNFSGRFVEWGKSWHRPFLCLCVLGASIGEGTIDNLFGPSVLLPLHACLLLGHYFHCGVLGIDYDGAGICVISPIDRGAVVY